MRLSKQSEYALRAMIHLGIAGELGLPTVSAVELAEANRLPFKFVERILQQLRKAGLVETKRGKLGGYALGTAPGKIRIGDLVRLMDGRLAPSAAPAKLPISGAAAPTKSTADSACS